VTAGIGADALAARFEAELDDYSAILVKALADRFAEAFAAYLHQLSRKAWGIDEARSADDVHHETHRGIRPAFGYPACPDHSEKFKLFDLLDAAQIGIALTESAAMTPAASVSGLYFAHPRARYFTVGRLGEDQIAGYSKRKGQSIDEVERWLTPNLAYEPARC
jgi:Methionine synthase I, cobalamin-binding domain